MLKMALRVLILLCFLHLGKSNDDNLIRTPQVSFVEGLRNGVKLAKDLFDSQSIVLKVSEFVVKALQANSAKNEPLNHSQNEKHDKVKNTNGHKPQLSEDFSSVLKNVVRLFGLKPARLGALTVNTLLFFVQLLSTMLAKPTRIVNENHNRDQIEWMKNKNSKNLQEILRIARDETLPDILENIVPDENPEDTSCIRLLLCKMTPIITNMQNIVFGNHPEIREKNSSTRQNILYRYLPEEKEITDWGLLCEQRNKLCDLNI